MASAIHPFVDSSLHNKENAPPLTSNPGQQIDADAIKAKLLNFNKQQQQRPALQPTQSSAQTPASSSSSSRQPLAPRADAAPTHANTHNSTFGSTSRSTTAATPSDASMLITEQQMRFNARSLTATETEERDKYVQLVRSNPESSSAWSALLHHDNSLIDGKPTPHMQNFALYQLARTVLLRKPPTRPDKHFGTVMLEYATLLCREDAAEGRHFFQWLLGQQSIPQQANIYLQWAAVEVWWKNMEKAKTILRQGIEKKVNEWEKLEKKLVDYTEREAKEKERHVSIAAPPAHVHVLPPASMHTTVTPAMSVSSSSSSAASAAASVAPPTPVVSGFSQADPITPSAAVTMSVNTPANRRRFNTRLLGLSKFGGAARVPSAAATADDDDDEDENDHPTTPAPESERPLERSSSMPARPTPAPPPGAAPQPPQSGMGDRTTNATTAAHSPLAHRSTHHLTGPTSGYLSVNNSALSTSSTSSSSSSSSNTSPSRTRTRQSVPAVPSTPQAPSLSNSVLLLADSSAAAASHAPTSRATVPSHSLPASTPSLAVAAASHPPIERIAQPAPAVVVVAAPPPASSSTQARLAQAPPPPSRIASSSLPPPVPAPALAAHAGHVAPPLASSHQPTAPSSSQGASAAPANNVVAAAKPLAAVDAKKEKERAMNEHMFNAFKTALLDINRANHTDLPVRVVIENKEYILMGKLGEGGSGQVFKALTSDMQQYALKLIPLRGKKHEEIAALMNEINLLKKLQNKPNIIRLLSHEQRDEHLHLVFEFGDTDLENLLKTMISNAKQPEGKFKQVLSDNFIRFYWQQMVEAVRTIHDEDIIHSDLKPMNFVCVKGVLKLIDFGISHEAQTDNGNDDATSFVRPNAIGTVNYMAPEMLYKYEEGFRSHKASDVWALGCILYQMVYAKSPLQHLSGHDRKVRFLMEQRPITFPPIRNTALLRIMQACLDYDRHARPDINEILACEFLCPKEQLLPLDS